MRPLSLTFAALLLAGAPTGSDAPIEYRVEAVHHKLVHHTVDGDVRVEAGAVLFGGASLSTGWWSSAELAAPAYAARFRVDSRTRFRLGGKQPGVLLELDRGRLRAVFDALLSSGPDTERTVRTPSALLAVRGTEYGVEVDRGGDTTVVVFRGTVEVSDPLRPGPVVFVSAGQQLRVRAGQPPGRPGPHGVSPDQWDRGRDPRSERPEARPWPDRPGAQQPGAPGGGSQPSPRGGGRGRG